MNNKLKKLYNQGGLLKALLQDPKQRKMAEDMLNKAEGGMSVKPYRSGGMMYQNGGQNDVDPPKTAARDAFSAFQKEIEKKYPARDAKVSLEDATQFLRLQRAADRELSAEVGDRRFEREKEIDALDRRSAVVSNRFGDSEQRRSQNKMMADEAAQRQYFTQEVQGRSFPPGAMMPKTEMERAQRLEMLKGIQQVKDDKEFEEYLKANEFEGFTPYDLQFVEGSDSYVEQPERLSPDALRRILKYKPINYYGKGGAAKTYRSGGMMYENGGETDPPSEMLSEATVIADRPSGYMSKLFVKEGMSGDDYSRERYNLGRELADKIMQQGMASPVSNKVVSALLGDQVDLDSMERKQLGYLRDKGFNSGLTDLQLQRGLLESGFVDKKTGSRLTEEAIKAAQSRGMKLTPDGGGLNATYFFQ